MSSGFVTEKELEDTRKRRQEEWERVRTADDPLERPEETFDNRSLFEKLQEQKQKKDLEYEEAHKLKNMIKGLDDDEIEFLDLVDRTKLAADKIKNLEEEKELNDYRNRVATLQEKVLNDKIHSEKNVIKPKAVLNGKISQTKLLQGVVLKTRKHKLDEGENGKIKDEHVDSAKQVKLNEDIVTSNNDKHNANQGGLKCIGILPGLGCYNDSSSEEDSSESECETPAQDPSMDLLGRKIQKKEKES